MSEDRADLAEVGGDDRTGKTHIFEELRRRAEELASIRVGNVRRHTHVAAGKKLQRARTLDETGHEDTVVQSAGRDSCSDLRKQLPVPDDDPARMGKGSHELREKLHSVPRPEGAHEPDRRLIRQSVVSPPLARRARSVGGELVDVDAVRVHQDSLLERPVRNGGLPQRIRDDDDE